jgi:hypothetical protein
VAKLEEELVHVDARLALAEGSAGAGEEWIDPEPTEPSFLRVVAARAGDNSLAVLCAPRAVLASDVIISSVPEFAPLGGTPSDSDTACNVVRLDLSLRESYEYRCVEEADAALSLVARRVKVAAFDSTDPARAKLCTCAAFDAIRRVVSVAIELPLSFDPSPDRAVIVEGVFLRGDPVTEITSKDPSKSNLMVFPLRIRSLPSEPLEVMKLAFIRVGRWNFGRTHDGLVFWNDGVEGQDGWELGELLFSSSVEVRVSSHDPSLCSRVDLWLKRLVPLSDWAAVSYVLDCRSGTL